MIGSIAKRYTPRDKYIGVLQKNYFREPGFASFKGSTFRSDYCSNETIVVENDTSKLWESASESNSYFIVSFSNRVLRLSHISMLSCIGRDCAYSLDVYGSNKGSVWELACTIRVEKTFFKGSVNNAECKSSYSYQKYKLVQNGTGENGNYYFPIYYLELFGDLYYKEPIIISRCSCRKHCIHCFIYSLFLLS